MANANGNQAAPAPVQANPEQGALQELVRQNREAAEDKAYPGMVSVRAFMTRIDNFRSIPIGVAHESLRAFIRGKHIQNNDVFALTQVVIPDDAHKVAFCEILRCTLPDSEERYNYHNVLILMDAGNDLLKANSDIVLELRFYLLPFEMQEFNDLNMTNLLNFRKYRKMQDTQGSGSREQFLRAFTPNQTLQVEPTSGRGQRQQGTQGAGALVVQHHPEYGYVADTAPLEAQLQREFHAQQQRITQLERMLEEVQQMSRGHGWGQPSQAPAQGNSQRNRSPRRGSAQNRERRPPPQYHQQGYQPAQYPVYSKPGRTAGAGYPTQWVETETLNVLTNAHWPLHTTTVFEDSKPPLTVLPSYVGSKSEEGCTNGGDLAGCLDDVDLDSLIEAPLGKHFIKSRLFHDLIHGTDERASEIAHTLRVGIDRAGWVFMPLLTRHHWVSSIVERDPQYHPTDSPFEFKATIIDSAAGPITRKDFHHFFNRLGVRVEEVRSHCRQPRNSNECGLHVVLMALYAVAIRRPTLPPQSEAELKLEAWRSELMMLKEQGKCPTLHGLFRLCPDARRIFPKGSVECGSKEKSTRNALAAQGKELEGGANTAPMLHGFDIPIAKAPKPGSEPNEVIDVDDDEDLADGTMMNMQDMKDAGIETNTPAIMKWFEGTLRSVNQSISDGVAKTRKQLEAMNAPEREKRLRDPNVRLMINPQMHNIQTIGVCLKDAPESILSNKRLVTTLRGIAEKIRASEKPVRQALEHEDVYNCPAGQYISTVIIDQVIDSIPQGHGQEWTVLKPLPFRMFAYADRLTEIPSEFKKNVALVMIHKSHYTLVTCRDGTLEYRDSLIGGRKAAELPEEITFLIGRFRNLLERKGIHTRGSISLEKCPLQQEVDCGIQAINNLSQVIFGSRGKMSRMTLRQAYLQRDRERLLPIWSTIWPTLAENPRKVVTNDAILNTSTQSTAEVAADRRASLHQAQGEPKAQSNNVPRESSSQQMKDTANDLCEACGRIAVLEGKCPWHHPGITKIKNRARCKATNSNNKPCRQLAITLEGIKHCGDHLTLHDRMALDRRTKKELSTRGPEATHVSREIAVGDGKGAMAHDQINAFVNTQTVETLMEVDSKAPGRSRVRMLVKIVKRATRQSFTTADVLAKWCTPCGCWHETSDMPLIPIPCIGVQFFRIVTIPQLPNDCTPDCEVDLDDDEETQEVEHIDLDRECIATPSAHPAGCITASVAQKWFIHPPGKPAHVHNIAWTRLTPNTRSRHRRWLEELRNTPPEMIRSPLATAVVEMVLRKAKERGWGWSTISSALSSVGSALEDLPIYTNAVTPIILRQDKYFADVCAHALQKAKIASAGVSRLKPLTKEEFEQLSQATKGSDSWVLLQLSWYLAARVGDVRKLAPGNLHVDSITDELGNTRISALFTDGKGAFFWGPYTIHAKIPEALATVIREFLLTTHAKDKKTLFIQADQDKLSKSIGKMQNHNLRSIRKGSLLFLADCGVSDEHLQLLSGHRRRDTLLRYLEWGQRSSDARAAADKRARQAAEAAPVSGGGTPKPQKPMAMGIHSGLNGERGRRVPPPPSLIRLQTPSWNELGLSDPSTTNGSSPEEYPLHVKNVACVNIDALLNMVESPDLKESLLKAASFLRTSQNYGINWPPLSPSEVPPSKYSPTDFGTMIGGKKMRPFPTAFIPIESLPADTVRIDDPSIKPLPQGTKIRCEVRGFPRTQEQKKKRRPLFVPRSNPNTVKGALPKIKYPSRRERRKMIAECKYFIEFDMVAWYDQLELDETVQDCYVVRSKNPIIVNGVAYTHFALTREPMGSTHSAQVAQTFTWAIAEPLIKNTNIKVFTTIDNVGIGAKNEDEFVRAVTIFLRRCAEANATVNDIEKLPDTREGLLKAGSVGRHTFLGEVYEKGRVLNTDVNVMKLQKSFERLQEALEGKVKVTKRQVASMIGLWTWMANTIEVPLNQHFDVIRMFSQISASPIPWDDEIRVTPHMVNCFRRAFSPVLLNTPVTPSCPSLPSLREDDYDAVIIVDACCTGYGAIVRTRNSTYEVKGGWRKYIQHSAWAEPLAALEMIRWTRRMCSGKLAIVTDHIALPSGQRRPITGNGGFSLAYHLNQVYSELYADGLDHQIFYVEGTKNPADAPSRATRIGDQISSNEMRDKTFPPLASFHHPYQERVEIPWWNV